MQSSNITLYLLTLNIKACDKFVQKHHGMQIDCGYGSYRKDNKREEKLEGILPFL